MDAALQAELLAVFIRVLAEVRRRLGVRGESASIYVCCILSNESVVTEHGVWSMAEKLWSEAGTAHGGDIESCGWWSQTPYGHGQRMLALESIIADLGGTPQ